MFIGATLSRRARPRGSPEIERLYAAIRPVRSSGAGLRSSESPGQSRAKLMQRSGGRMSGLGQIGVRTDQCYRHDGLAVPQQYRRRNGRQSGRDGAVDEGEARLAGPLQRALERFAIDAEATTFRSERVGRDRARQEGDQYGTGGGDGDGKNRAERQVAQQKGGAALPMNDRRA